MNKQQLKDALELKELVKPNSMENRLSREVETLCEGYTCGLNVSRPAGDTDEQNDIVV